MDVFLFGLDLEGDNDDYAELLAKAGYRTPDELLLKEPDLEDILAAGINDIKDAEKIYKAIHPEDSVGSKKTLSVDDILSSTLGDFGIEGLDFGTSSGGHSKMDGLMEKYTHVMAEGARVSVFDKNSFDRAKGFIEKGNTVAFKEAIQTMDINMKDPSDGNTLLHWAVAMNRKPMCEDLLVKAARQEENSAGKSPMELAMDAVKHGDSSYIPLRNFLWQEIQKTLHPS